MLESNGEGYINDSASSYVPCSETVSKFAVLYLSPKSIKF